MRDLMMLGAMMFIVPITLANAFAAYLVWGWTSVISVPFYLYGFMGSLRYNLIFAAVTLTLVLLGQIKDKGAFTLNRTTFLILLFLAHCTVSAVLAAPSAINNFSIYTDLLKSITYCLVMFLFMTSRFRFHAMLVAIALGLGFHGGVEGLKTLATGGGHKVIGIPGSKMSDNNHFGVAIVMVLPILLYLYQYSKFRLIRLGFLLLTGLTVLAVVGSNSRGAFLAMSAIGLIVMLTSRRKVLSIVIVLAAAAMVLVLSPDDWFSRIETIGNAGEDQSFMSRVEAWNVSTAIALANPIFGSGFHAMQSGEVWFGVRPSQGLLSSFVPAATATIARAAHSIYFEVLADLGFFGLFLFLAIMFNAFLTARDVRRLASQLGPDMVWARDLGDTLSMSCVAYAVGGAGVSLGYFETFYVVVVLLEALKQYLLRVAVQARRAVPYGAAFPRSP